MEEEKKQSAEAQVGVSCRGRRQVGGCGGSTLRGEAQKRRKEERRPEEGEVWNAASRMFTNMIE